MQHILTYSSYLQAKNLLLYKVVVRIWDPIWLTVLFIHNVTDIYYAIISSVKCVACAKLLVSVVLLLFELSWSGVGWGFFWSTCTSVCFCFLFMGRLRLVFLQL